MSSKSRVMEYKTNEFKNLKVWQKAMEFAVNIYSVTRKFPNEEKFGLAAQINKSAVSIPSNIAESVGRGSKKEFAQFLWIAYGSSYEIETTIKISKPSWIHFVRRFRVSLEEVQ